MSDVHSSALLGFDRNAAAYHRGRPEYPGEIAAWLRDALGIRSGQTVVDLAAGTGKFSKSLLQTGASVIAIEPVDAMRAELTRNLPEARAIAGTAESMPRADGSADAVVSAQAFHWFATRAALEEIHRVLKPGGALGFVWNMPDLRVDWVAAIDEIIRPYEVDAPYLFRTGEWRRVFTGELFSIPAETLLAHQHVGAPRHAIVDRALSLSFIAKLQPSAQADVAGQLNGLVATHPGLRGRAAVAFPYRTYAYRGLRLSA